MNILLKNIPTVLDSIGIAEVKSTDICIGGSKILSVGSVPEGFAPEKTIDGSGKFAVPGFVNAHTHAYMSLFRNSADDLAFGDWLFGRIEPMEDKLTPSDHYWGTQLGICEMLRCGTTAYLDMHMMPHECAKAVSDSGIRAVLSRGLVGQSRTDEGGLRRIREAKADIREFAGVDKITFMLAPHAPYSCSPEFISLVCDTAAELKIGIHTHLSESDAEIESTRKKYGCTPIELMEKSGLFDFPCTAAHCVKVTENDMDILAEKGVRVVTNPASNMKLGNGFAPVARMLEKGITVALGTDGAASNNNLNIIKELSLLTLIHKGTSKSSQCISAREGLKIATENGANALGLPLCGAIQAGMNADIAIFDTSCPQLSPCSDLISALSYSACGSEVSTVICGGDILMEDRHLLTIDEERVLYEANMRGKRLCTI